MLCILAGDRQRCRIRVTVAIGCLYFIGRWLYLMSLLRYLKTALDNHVPLVRGKSLEGTEDNSDVRYLNVHLQVWKGKSGAASPSRDSKCCALNHVGPNPSALGFPLFSVSKPCISCTWMSLQGWGRGSGPRDVSSVCWRGRAEAVRSTGSWSSSC